MHHRLVETQSKDAKCVRTKSGDLTALPKNLGKNAVLARPELGRFVPCTLS